MPWKIWRHYKTGSDTELLFPFGTNTFLYRFCLYQAVLHLNLPQFSRCRANSYYPWWTSRISGFITADSCSCFINCCFFPLAVVSIAPLLSSAAPGSSVSLAGDSDNPPWLHIAGEYWVCWLYDPQADLLCFFKRTLLLAISAAFQRLCILIVKI